MGRFFPRKITKVNANQSTTRIIGYTVVSRVFNVSRYDLQI